jgi:hypothetical protein
MSRASKRRGKRSAGLGLRAADASGRPAADGPSGFPLAGDRPGRQTHPPYGGPRLAVPHRLPPRDSFVRARLGAGKTCILTEHREGGPRERGRGQKIGKKGEGGEKKYGG